MAVILTKFLGDGPYPYPMDIFSQAINSYTTSQFLVITLKAPIDFFAEDVHAHESYEFLIPYTPMPLSKIGQATIKFEINKLFAINSWQTHGPVEPCFGCDFLAFQADRSFVRDIAHSMYGQDEPVFMFGGYTVDYEITELIRLFKGESDNKQAGYRFIMESISTQIIVKLLRQLKSNLPSVLKEYNYKDKSGITRVTEFFREHYNKQYSLAEVAQLANLSPYHFIRVFKAHTGKTPYGYLVDVKIEKACTLLRDRNLTITDVCYLCGFNSLNHFGTVFKRKLGTSPSDYRSL